MTNKINVYFKIIKDDDLNNEVEITEEKNGSRGNKKKVHLAWLAVFASFMTHFIQYGFLYNKGSTVVWSSLGHPLGSTQKVPCRRQCLTGGPFLHCKLAKWEQPKGALQAKVPYRGGALQGHDHCITHLICACLLAVVFFTT